MMPIIPRTIIPIYIYSYLIALERSMADFIIICLLIGLGFTSIVVGLIKSAITPEEKATASKDLDDITNPSHRWHPLNI
jgi:ABC-type enterochelin transport system permease subunit